MVASVTFESKYTIYAKLNGASKNIGSNNFKYNFRFFLNKKTGKRKTTRLNKEVNTAFRYSCRRK
jgi:hypothetical protein